jgi:hypothetical protein
MSEDEAFGRGTAGVIISRARRVLGISRSFQSFVPTVIVHSASSGSFEARFDP